MRAQGTAKELSSGLKKYQAQDSAAEELGSRASIPGPFDRPADSREAAGKRKPGRPDINGHHRINRGDRPVRSPAQRKTQNLRGIQNTRRDPGQLARPGLGAASAAQAFQAD